MKKKIIGIFVCMLVIATAIPVIGAPSDIQKIKSDTRTRTSFGTGWIEQYDDLTILSLNGSNYEMGYQYGSLASDEIHENYRAITNALGSFGITYFDLLHIWEIQSEYTPIEYIDEMQGMADGSGLKFEKICVLQIVDMFYRCCGAAAWGPATADGKLIHLRSFDYDRNIKDPETGTFMQENQLIIIRNPDVGYASLSPVLAGLCGSLGGINEQQISIGQMTEETEYYQPDTTNNGTPMMFRIRYALDYASSVQEAITILNSNRTVGWTFIVSDGKEPVGYVLEQTANFSYYGTFDDPVESKKPFVSIDHVVRRTNLFISPECAAKQRRIYNPAFFIGYARWILLKLGLPVYSYWGEYTHYKALSTELSDHWGNLNLNTTMNCLRDVYNFKTNCFIWKLFGISFFIIYGIKPYQHNIHQWVACPETGDIFISFADADTPASENTVYQLNFYDILGS